jgi:hypothetical protein
MSKKSRGPEADLALAGGVEVVEVAGESRLRVVGDEEVVAVLGPEDVAEHLHVARRIR